ncbi:MAG TPA: hypothetical protein VIV12_21375 [Streptosporangiaceae bacterium]
MIGVPVPLKHLDGLDSITPFRPGNRQAAEPGRRGRPSWLWLSVRVLGMIGGMDGEVGREPQYDVFADEFLDHAREGFFNAHYDRPACLALLGDVAGKRVLDAACGPGLCREEQRRACGTGDEFGTSGPS